MKREKISADGLHDLENEKEPKIVCKKNGKRKLKFKTHQRLKKALACCTVGAVLCGGIFGVNALFFQKATPNVVDEGFVTVSYRVPDDGSTPDMHNALENIGYMNYRLRTQDNYYSEMHGSVSATVKMLVEITVEQQVSTYKQYSDNVLILTDITTSSMVQGAHQFCYVGDRVIWREAAGGASSYDGLNTQWKDGDPFGNMTVGDFKAKNGLPGTDFAVYVINEETLLSADPVVSNGDGTYSQTYYLDPALDKAPAYYVNQMMFTGGLNSLPSFEYITVTYTFDSTWQILSSEIEEKYTATMGAEASCFATYRTDYRYGTDLAVSDAYDTYYKNYAEKPATGAPDDGPSVTAAGCLSAAFAPVLSGPVTFGADLELNGVPAEGYVYVNAGNASALEIRAQIGGVYVAYTGEEAYLRFSDAVKLKLDPAALSGLFGASGKAEGAGISLDLDALLAQLGAGAFEVSEDGSRATLVSELSLGGISLPVRFEFLIAEDGAVSLGCVSTQFEMAGIEVAAELFYAEGEVPALSQAEKEEYADFTPHLATVTELLSSDVLNIAVGYKGGSVAVSGDVRLSLRQTIAAQADLTVSYRGVSRTIRLSCIGGAAYIDLDGMRLKAKLGEALDLLGRYLDLSAIELPDAAEFDLSALLSKVLAPGFVNNFAVTEEDDAVTVLVKGTELLKAFGVDFALGDVKIGMGEGALTAEALGVNLCVTKGEAFKTETDGYVDILPVMEDVLQIVKEQKVALSGAFEVVYGGTEMRLEIQNGVLSWKNGFALSLDAMVTVGGIGQTIRVFAGDNDLQIVYGSVGVDLEYAELSQLSDAFNGVCARIGALAEDIFDARTAGLVSDTLAQFAAGGAVTELLQSLDLPGLIGGLRFSGATERPGSIAVVSYGALSLELVSAADGVNIVLDRFRNDNITVSGEFSAVAAGTREVQDCGDRSQYLNTEDLSDVIDFVGAAIGTLASGDVSVSFKDGATIYTSDSSVKFTIDGTVVYHSGGSGLPIHIDTEGKTLTVNPDCYAYVGLRLISETETSLYFDFWMLDADDNDELEFYISLSKYASDHADYRPLRFSVSASDLLTLLSGGLELAGVQDGALYEFFTQGVGLDEATVKALVGVLDDYLISQWLTAENKAQLQALGGIFMKSLGVDAALEKLFGTVGDAFGNADLADVSSDPGAYLTQLNVLRAEGAVSLVLGLDSDLVFGGSGLSDMQIELSKTGPIGESRMNAVALRNIYGSSAGDRTSVSFAFSYEPVALTASEGGVTLAVPDAQQPSLLFDDYKNYMFAGVDELLKSLALSATHQTEDGGYALNSKFIVEGSVNGKIGSYAIAGDEGIGVKVAVSVAADGTVAINARIEYKAIKAFLIIPVIESDGVTELTIVNGMIYLRRTAGDGVTHRVMPLENFMSGLLSGQLQYLLNLSDTVQAIINAASGGNEETPAENASDDYGRILGNILNSYTYTPQGQSGASEWVIDLNGESLTGGVLGSMQLTLGADAANVLRSLGFTSKLASIFDLEATLAFKNPCGEPYDDPTEDLVRADVFAQTAQAVAAFDWEAQDGSYYIVPAQTEIRYLVDGEEVASQTVWYDANGSGVPFDALVYPSLDGYRKEGHTLEWKEFFFAPGGTVEAVNTPNLYDVTFICPVKAGDAWTAAGDGTYRYTTQMLYGSQAVLQWGDKSAEFYVGAADNVFDLGKTIGDEVLWNEMQFDLAANGAVMRVPLAPDTVVYTSSGVSFSLAGSALTEYATAEFDAQYTLLEPAAEGYTFLGWYIMEEGTPVRLTQLLYAGGGNETTLSAMWISDLANGTITTSTDGSLFIGYDQKISYAATGGALAGEYAQYFTVSASIDIALKWNTIPYNVDSTYFVPSQTQTGWQTGVATSHTGVSDPKVYITFTVSVLLNGESVGATSISSSKKC